MARFLPLKVTDVRRETRDAVVLTLAPRDEDRALFGFTQGQYLTFRRSFDGEELRRSYSICAGVDDGCLQVGIKRVDGGAFSTWVNENLAPGDEIEAMPPMGKFSMPLDPDAARHYVGFAAGSGITPVLSIVKTVLRREPKSRFTLVYANRQISSIMFREELEDLKNLYLGRFSVLHVLESEAQEIDPTGQLRRTPVRELAHLDHVQRAGDARLAFVLAHPADLQRKGQVLSDGHVRKQRIVLEHHADPALVRRHLVDRTPAKTDLSVRRSLEARQHHQAGRLAGTGRPQHRQKFTPSDRQIQVFDDKCLSIIAFLHMLEGDECVAVAVVQQKRSPCYVVGYSAQGSG